MASNPTWHSGDDSNLLVFNVTHPQGGAVASKTVANVSREGGTVNIHGGTVHSANNIYINHHNYGPPTQGMQGTANEQDPVTKLKGYTNMSLRISPSDISSKRTPNTGRIFQAKEQCKEWHTVANSVLWASGDPGAGKTYLASAIFDSINDTAKTNPFVACTVIYLKQNEQWTTWDIVSVIIIDLVESNPLPAALDAISETLKSQRPNERPSLSDMVALLHKIVKLYGRCYILIDGPDEMKAEIQVELVDIIAELRANVLLTSRPLTLVQDKLAEMARNRPVFMTFAAEAEDLETYIKHVIHRTPTFASLLGESFPEELLIKKVQTNARGMFLHAALQMEALKDCINQKELIDLIDRFPPGLMAMYADIVKRIERQPPRHVSHAKTALVWLVHAHGSLTFDDLRCATATVAPDYTFEADRQFTEGILLTICRGLVTLDPETRQARLIHATAWDALRAILADHFPKPHAMIANACISRLVEFGFHQAKNSYYHDLHDLYNRVPLVRYAHESIQHHVQQGVKEDLGLFPRVEQFIRQCTLYPYEDPQYSVIHLLPALHVAILFNQQPIVEKLLIDGTEELNTATGRTWSSVGGITPLGIASAEGLDDLARYLLTLPGILANGPESDYSLTPLMLAAINGREAVCKLLVSHLEGATRSQDVQGPQHWVNYSRRWKTTALHLSALRGHVGVVQILLGVDGVDVNQADMDRASPLIRACEQGHVEVVRLLLGAPGIDVNQADDKGRSSLAQASERGHIEVVTELLLGASGIDVNQADSYLQGGRSPLARASEAGHVEVVKLLLGAPGIDVNQADDKGRSSLAKASEEGHVEVVKLLLAAPGIDVNQADKKGWSSLARASGRGHTEVVQLLLGASAKNIHRGAANNWWLPLILAFISRHFEVTKLLFNGTNTEGNMELLLNIPGIDINQRNAEGVSLLLMACENGDVNMVKLLLDAPGINVNQADDFSRSPLAQASEGGHVEVVKLLLGAPGIKVNQADDEGRSPLAEASQKGHSEVVKLLLGASGIRVNMADHEGRSPLAQASEEGHVEVVKLLLGASGIDADQVDHWGTSALARASTKGHIEVVKLLLSVPDIDITHQDMEGETALTSASRAGHHEIARMLSAALPTPPMPASADPSALQRLQSGKISPPSTLSHFGHVPPTPDVNRDPLPGAPQPGYPNRTPSPTPSLMDIDVHRTSSPTSTPWFMNVDPSRTPSPIPSLMDIDRDSCNRID